MPNITKLIFVFLVLFGVSACDKSSSDRQPASVMGASEAPGGSPGPSGDMPPHPPVEASGGTISGTITLDPILANRVTDQNVVYIIARSADMPGPPVAVQQLRNIKFPYPYTLSSADLMMQGGAFQGRINIVIRVDRDGAAGPPQPGDLEGVYAGNPATVGDQKVDVVINKAF